MQRNGACFALLPIAQRIRNGVRVQGVGLGLRLTMAHGPHIRGANHLTQTRLGARSRRRMELTPWTSSSALMSLWTQTERGRCAICGYRGWSSERRWFCYPYRMGWMMMICRCPPRSGSSLAARRHGRSARSSIGLIAPMLPARGVTLEESTRNADWHFVALLASIRSTVRALQDSQSNWRSWSAGGRRRLRCRCGGGNSVIKRFEKVDAPG